MVLRALGEKLQDSYVITVDYGAIDAFAEVRSPAVPACTRAGTVLTCLAYQEDGAGPARVVGTPAGGSPGGSGGPDPVHRDDHRIGYEHHRLDRSRRRGGRPGGGSRGDADRWSRRHGAGGPVGRQPGAGDRSGRGAPRLGRVRAHPVEALPELPLRQQRGWVGAFHAEPVRLHLRRRDQGAGPGVRVDGDFGVTVPRDVSAPNVQPGTATWFTARDWADAQPSYTLDQQGTGGVLRLEPTGLPVGASRAAQTDVKPADNETPVELTVTGNQRADLAADEVRITAKVGETVPVKIGYTNRGPASSSNGGRDFYTIVKMTVPKGVTAVKAPKTASTPTSRTKRAASRVPAPTSATSTTSSTRAGRSLSVLVPRRSGGRPDGHGRARATARWAPRTSTRATTPRRSW